MVFVGLTDNEDPGDDMEPRQFLYRFAMYRNYFRGQ